MHHHTHSCNSHVNVLSLWVQRRRTVQEVEQGLETMSVWEQYHPQCCMPVYTVYIAVVLGPVEEEAGFEVVPRPLEVGGNPQVVLSRGLTAHCLCILLHLVVRLHGYGGWYRPIATVYLC